MVALPLVDADAPGRGTSPEVSIILAPRSRGSRRAVGREPQAQSLPRPLRLVAEIFPADPGALHQLDPAGQDAVRLGLAGDHAGPLARRFRQARDPRGDQAEGAEGERAAAAEYLGLIGTPPSCLAYGQSYWPSSEPRWAI